MKMNSRKAFMNLFVFQSGENSPEPGLQDIG